MTSAVAVLTPSLDFLLSEMWERPFQEWLEAYSPDLEVSGSTKDSSTTDSRYSRCRRRREG